jgi:hypothetical protein
LIKQINPVRTDGAEDLLSLIKAQSFHSTFYTVRLKPTTGLAVQFSEGVPVGVPAGVPV